MATTNWSEKVVKAAGSTFPERYDAMRQLFEDDELKTCVEQAEALLAEHHLSRYLRIKTLLVMICSVDSWEDAEEYRLEAESLWSAATYWYRFGVSDGCISAETLQELRKSLDDVARLQKDTHPPQDGSDEFEHSGVGDADEARRGIKDEGDDESEGTDTDEKIIDRVHEEADTTAALADMLGGKLNVRGD